MCSSQDASLKFLTSYHIRSKTHCDKRVPCNACSKKGLRHLCPDSTLTSGDGSRLVESFSTVINTYAFCSRIYSTTAELREKSNELSNRVQELEEALRISHALNSSGRHPLLSDDLIAIKEPFLRRSLSPSVQSVSEATSRDSQGTLTMYPSGHTQYYGPSSTAWVSKASYFVNL
jgi:hypothetical protein